MPDARCQVPGASQKPEPAPEPKVCVLAWRFFFFKPKKKNNTYTHRDRDIVNCTEYGVWIMELDARGREVFAWEGVLSE